MRAAEEKFNYEAFLDTFNLKVSEKPFDWERFVETFFGNQQLPPFDYKKFVETFFEAPKGTQTGGAVVIVDSPSRNLRGN